MHHGKDITDWFKGGPHLGAHNTERRERLAASATVSTQEKFFRNLIKSNRNQIVFTIFRLIWNSKRTVSVFGFKFNRKLVNTI